MPVIHDAAEPAVNQDLSHSSKASRVSRASTVAKKNLLMQRESGLSGKDTAVPHSRSGLNIRPPTTLSSKSGTRSKKGTKFQRGALPSQWSELDEAVFGSVPPPAAAKPVPVAGRRTSAAKRAAFARSTTSMLENPVEEEVIEIAHPQIVAWKQKDSFHKLRAQQKLQESQKAQEREEGRMTKSHILGMANLNAGESAREFLIKSSNAAGEGGQAEGNPLLRTFNMANLSPTLKEDYRDNKK